MVLWQKRALRRLSLMGLLLLGAALRYINLSAYTFYPDSFQNMTIARLITEHGRLSGPLGESGFFYPQFIQWTRPVYPLLIAASHLIVPDWYLAARIVAFLFGLLGLVLAYLLGATWFGQRRYGLAAVFLSAVSFNHVVWGGFILTETVGVFFLLLCLVLLGRLKRTQGPWLSFWLGIASLLAVLTRYEYATLIPLLLVAVWQLKGQAWRFWLAGWIVGLLAVWPLYLGVELWRLEPFQSGLVRLAAISAGAAALTGLVFLREWRFRFGLVWLAFLGLAVLLPGFRAFWLSDFLLSGLFLLGAWRLSQESQKGLVAGLLLACILLSATYGSSNAAMQRYWTHLIPFLLIPAAYGLVWLVSVSKSRTQRPIRLLLLVAVLIQLGLTARGIHGWGSGTWFRQSYQVVSAQLLAERLKPTDQILVVGEPEPVYLTSKLTILSVADEYPFIYYAGKLVDQPAVIVLDMGMRHNFPVFTAAVEERLVDRQVANYKTGERYHAGAASYDEAPVELYRTTLNELRRRLSSLSVSDR